MKMNTSPILKTSVYCYLLMLFGILPATIWAQVNNVDESNAEMYAKKYKDDAIMCTSAYQFYTFDKGKNALNDKVV